MTHCTALHVLIPHPRQKSLHAILPLQWHAGSLHFLQKVKCFDNVLCASSHLKNAELIRPAILAAMRAASICLVQCLRPIGPSPYHVAAVKIIWSVLQDERAASEAVSFLSGAGLLFCMLDIFLECHDIIHAPLWRYCINRAFSPYKTTFFTEIFPGVSYGPSPKECHETAWLVTQWAVPPLAWAGRTGRRARTDGS